MATPAPAGSIDYIGYKLFIFTIIFIPVQIFAVELRFNVRHFAKQPWGISDLMVLTSLVAQMCMAAIAFGM